MTAIPDSDWTAEQLTGGFSGKKGKGVAEDPMLWGLPGHLTADEVAIYEQFAKEVDTRGGDFQETVYCFGHEEGKVWALCRWLRARKFVLEDVLKMVEEATQVRADAKKNGFYPNPVDALGVPEGIFFAQYPQLYFGAAKNGAPLFISKPGVINTDGIECITTLDGIIKFHWYIMMHDFANRLRAQKEKNPNFKRFECFCILDLKKLSLSQLGSRTMAIIKEQAAIDSVCFPETMSKMLIVNAPTFFSATWRIIKGWLDPRTANKIEVISSKSTMEKRLLELVEAENLPSDYGGKGPTTESILAQNSPERLEAKVLGLRGHGSETMEVKAGETLEVTIYTRSVPGAKFSLTNADSKAVLMEPALVKHSGTEDVTEQPSHMTLSQKVTGPMNVKIKADSNAGRFTTQNYLLVGRYFK